MSDKYVLNAEQFAFMQKFYFLFRLDSFHRRITGARSPVLEMLMQSETFKNLFGDMSIDDLLDRYSSTEGYEHDFVLQERLLELWTILSPYLPERPQRDEAERMPFDFSEEGIKRLKDEIKRLRDGNTD